MDASTILNMITDKQLDSSTEVAAFLSADTDCYLLLMGIQHVKGYNKAEYTEVVAGYAAVNRPDELAHFINDLTDLTVLNTLNGVATRETVVGTYIEHVYTPMVNKVFLEKGKAFIRHNGLVACGTPPERIFGALDEDMQALGFYNSSMEYTDHTLEEFEVFYQRLLSTKYFVYNPSTHEDSSCQYNIINFKTVIPVKNFPKVYARESTEWRKRIERDAHINITLTGMYDTKTRVIELTEESCLHFKSGTRRTCVDHVAPRYEQALVAAAQKLLHAKIPAVKTIKPVKFRILEESSDFMARVLGEGAELMAKEAAYASDSSKTAIDVKAEPKILKTAFAQTDTSRGMCPECGEERTCDMDEIEHDLYACGHCGVEVPKSCVLEEWQLDPVTGEWTLKPEVK